jgi:hypothetical protein
MPVQADHLRVLPAEVNRAFGRFRGQPAAQFRFGDKASRTRSRAAIPVKQDMIIGNPIFFL